MLLQTNSYLVPREKRAAHARLMRQFRQELARLGYSGFEVYELAGPHWLGQRTADRFVQLMRFRDRSHFQQVQAAERGDAVVQAVVKEFCSLIDVGYQQQAGLFGIGYYISALSDAGEMPAMSQGVSGGTSVDFTTIDADAAKLSEAAETLRKKESAVPPQSEQGKAQSA